MVDTLILQMQYWGDQVNKQTNKQKIVNFNSKTKNKVKIHFHALTGSSLRERIPACSNKLTFGG